MRLLVSLVFVGLVALLIPKSLQSPRGIRNNNPGNIRWDGSTQWIGMTGQDDKGFVIFDTPEHGIRAMNRVLNTYSQYYGLNTISGIIERWAPTSENNTVSYVMAVEASTQIPKDQMLGKSDRSTLIAAIIKHENGMQPYPEDTINRGIALA